MRIVLNGQKIEVRADTVAELVASRHASARGIAVAVNGEVLPRAGHTRYRLREDDVVELVSAVQGG